jgi:Kef-type K+ transport system membrane component KefB
MDIMLTNLTLIAAIAFAAPLVASAVPAVVLPAVVLEIVAGIALGPQGLELIAVDEAVRVMAILGLAFLLFLAGLEVDLGRLHGPVLRTALISFALSFTIGLAVGGALVAIGAAQNVVFIATVLSATSLGIIVPVIKDAGVIDGPFGQTVLAAASVADFAAVILVTALFSAEGGGTASRIILLTAFVVGALLTALALRGVEHVAPLSRALVRLQDTTAQIRVRGAFLLLAGSGAIAMSVGIEAILGTFVAGLLVSFADRDEMRTHPQFRTKLEGAGFGFFIPVFFVAVGLRFDLDGVVGDPAALASVPLFVLALLVVRGVPALLLIRSAGLRLTLAAAALQATSLPFIVAATLVGVEAGVITSATAASLVGAGVVSVLVFPAIGAALITTGTPDATPAGAPRLAREM